MAAALESIHFINAMDMHEIELDIRQKGSWLTRELKKMSGIELLSSTNMDEVGGIVSFRPLSKPFKQVYDQLSKENFRIRQVPESDVNCLRISMHIYNSMQDIENFVSSLGRLVR